MKKQTSCIILGNITFKDGIEEDSETLTFAVRIYLDDQKDDQSSDRREIVIQCIAECELWEMASTGKHHFVQLCFTKDNSIYIDEFPNINK